MISGNIESMVAVIETLLSGVYVRFSIKVTDEEVIITAEGDKEAELIASSLQTTLSSSENLSKILHYTVKIENTESKHSNIDVENQNQKLIQLNTNKSGITINISDLIDRLRQLIPGGSDTLIRVYKKDDNTPMLQPIFFTSKALSPKPIHFIFLIDPNYSMLPYAKEFKENLKSLLKTLSEKDYSKDAKITFFTINAKKEVFSLSSLKEIKEYLDAYDFTKKNDADKYDVKKSV